MRREILSQIYSLFMWYMQSLTQVFCTHECWESKKALIRELEWKRSEDYVKVFINYLQLSPDMSDILIYDTINFVSFCSSYIFYICGLCFNAAHSLLLQKMRCWLTKVDSTRCVLKREREKKKTCWFMHSSNKMICCSKFSNTFLLSSSHSRSDCWVFHENWEYNSWYFW